MSRHDDEADKFVNHYHCDECDIEWEDTSASTNNDRCPKCRAEIEPHHSDDI